MQEIHTKLDKILKWQEDHQKYDEQIHREQDARLGKIPSDLEIEVAVNNALIKFFSAKGILTKNIIITTAIIVGSLAVIGGAGKAILGWIGFSYLGK